MAKASESMSVTPEEIRAIPEMYAIGKRPLSILLGWGELTYTRLLEGTSPSAAHSATLRRLHDDPLSYARLLEQQRSRITDTAYRRSRRAVEAILGEDMIGATKIFCIADRICALSGGDITPNALQKLLYYAQGTWFAQHQECLFEQLPRASATGPFYDQIADDYSYDDIQEIARRAQAKTSAKLSDKKASFAGGPSTGITWEEAGIVDAVYERLGDYSGSALSRMAMSEAPWRKARKRADVPDGKDCAEPITAKSMIKYFTKNPL